MAVCWGFGPLDDSVLMSISSPGSPGMSGHAAGLTVTREPLPHRPDRDSGRYDCDARLAGPSVSLLLADKTDKTEHGQSR